MTPNRREFNQAVLGTVAAAALPALPVIATEPKTDVVKQFEDVTLAAIGGRIHMIRPDSQAPEESVITRAAAMTFLAGGITILCQGRHMGQWFTMGLHQDQALKEPATFLRAWRYFRKSWAPTTCVVEAYGRAEGLFGAEPDVKLVSRPCLASSADPSLAGMTTWEYVSERRREMSFGAIIDSREILGVVEAPVRDTLEAALAMETRLRWFKQELALQDVPRPFRPVT